MIRQASIARLAALLIAAALTAACASGAAGPVVVNPGPFPKAPNPNSPEARLARELDSVLRTATDLKGTKYRAGGESPATGFDCSGFVRYVYHQHKIELPRTVETQFKAGKKIPVEQLRKGDLVFFSTNGKGPTHVGIALGTAGPAEFVHAPGSGGSVRIERFDTAYWKGKLVGVRRVN